MKKLEAVDLLKQICEGSRTFSGFVFQGNYIMKRDIFHDAFREFLKTGKNYLDDYSEFYYFLWEGDPAKHDKWNMRYYDEKDLVFIENILLGLHPFIAAPENAQELKIWVQRYRERQARWEKNKKINDRRKAQKLEKEALAKNQA